MSKLKKVGYVSLGVLLGASLTVSVPALAATAKTIQAKINSSVSVMVDGKKMSTQPINYQNLNYLPVGEIGRALDADVSFDKSKNVISIESKNDTTTSNSGNGGTGSSGNTTTPPVTETPTQATIPTVKAGESITAKGVTVSIDKIEYVTDGEKVDGSSLRKGFKVFMTITNNTKSNLVEVGGTLVFDAGNFLKSKNINSLGATFKFNVDGSKYNDSQLQPGKTASGYIYYEFDQDVSIGKIQFSPIIDRLENHDYIGTWTFE
ncbi:stalk domain-containing protein [Paenibacillus sp. QZ-Y1]|uniref:stalk domain-containing protein n=1 Tax=Paenibacillus sp. QZ-Y1 TaxID=3414511 RepID=UPI003F791706